MVGECIYFDVIKLTNMYSYERKW